MRPTKLVISAFGPYAETMPEIDFEQFEERGLFGTLSDLRRHRSGKDHDL